jgi:hypothetical protein
MKKIKILKIVFNQEISQREVSFFRGAVIDKVKNEKDNVLFHNHNKQTYRYAYPLIQYKRIRGKAAFVAVEDGTDQIHKFFQQSNWDLRLGNRHDTFQVENLSVNDFTMQVWDKWFNYTIFDWLALNEVNYKKYKDLKSESERENFLESILKANVLSFAKGIDWNVDKPIDLKIVEIQKSFPLSFKGQRLLGFRVKFKTNVFIPNDLGLGKGVSLGFGMIKAERKPNGK